LLPDFLNRFSELVALYTFRSKIAGVFVILSYFGGSSFKKRELRLSFKQISGGLSF